MKESGAILFLINSLGRGGAEKMFVAQANTLHGEGVDVYVGVLYGARGGFADDLAVPREKVIEFGFRGLRDVRALLRVARFLRARRVRLVYSTLEEANIVARVAGLLVPSVRVVIRESNTADRKRLKFKLLDIVLNIRVKWIVAVSRSVRSSLVRYLRMYASKIVVVENGVRVPESIPERSPERSDVRLLNVGSLTEQKNQAALLRIMKALAADFPDVHLSIAGEGSERGALEKSFASLGLSGRVELHGRLDTRGVERLYRESDIFISTSLWEGSPNVVLEAMSWGLPVVSFAVGGTIDAVEDGKTGYLVRIGDESGMAKKLAELLSDASERLKMGNRGRERARERYSLEMNIARLRELLL